MNVEKRTGSMARTHKPVTTATRPVKSGIWSVEKVGFGRKNVCMMSPVQRYRDCVMKPIVLQVTEL